MEIYEEIVLGVKEGGRHWRSAGRYIFNGFLEKSVTFGLGYKYFCNLF